MAAVVICLCAQWCDICERYREVFDAVAREHGHALRFRWLDIEDEEEEHKKQEDGARGTEQKFRDLIKKTE